MAQSTKLLPVVALLLTQLCHSGWADVVVFSELPGNGFQLSNGLVRTRWSAETGAIAAARGALTQTFDVSGAQGSTTGWLKVGDSQGVSVAVRNFPYNNSLSLRQKLAIPGLDHSLPAPTILHAAPTSGTKFEVSGNGTTVATIRYTLTLGSDWVCHATITLKSGEHYIHEQLDFSRLAANGTHTDEVRVMKHFHTAGIPADLQLSFWRAVNYCGWAWPGASLVVQSLGRWSPQSGGGAFPDLAHWSGNKIHIGPEFSVAHQAPPAKNDQSERLNWITLEDVAVGEAYTLEHNIVARPGYHFDREFLEYLWQLSPPQELAPRFSPRHTVDKMLFALQYTPGPAGDVGGGFRNYLINGSGVVNGSGPLIEIGFIAQAWYNYLGQLPDPNDPSTNNFTLLIQHSPDWGAGMDAWSCVFMLLYKQLYGDTPDEFINRTTEKMINGFVHLKWNLEDESSTLNGAMWQAWDAQRGMHPADFLGPTRIFWLCDSGKSGYMFLRLYELTGSKNTRLFARAEAAARFLLRIQLPSGDFAGSVYSSANQGAPIKPPNYAATTSAILLWAKLHEITGNATWLAAAESAARAVAANYLQPGAIQINGGELDDVMVNDGSRPGGLNVHGVSGGTYGVMALSQLALVTNKTEHVALVRQSMDYMLAWQWTQDINMGYYNSKARFQGADMKTVGASVNGMVRSEVTLYSWMAYRATGDRRYLASFEQNHHWLTYQQYDNFYDTHFFGGGDEGLSPYFQYINGVGCNFFGETTGQGVGLMEYLISKRKALSEGVIRRRGL